MRLSGRGLLRRLCLGLLLPLVTAACAQKSAGTKIPDAAVAHDLAATDGAPTRPLDFAVTDAAPLLDAAAPGRYHIDLSRTSVSGISSGGFMAVQFNVAFSSLTKGAAVFAGGPYGCSGGSAVVAASSCASGVPSIDVSALVKATQASAAAGTIDATSNLMGQRVFLFGGADDVVVYPAVVDALANYYRAFLPAASVRYVNRRPGTAHTWPTESYGNPCALLASPYLGDCSYDGAGMALQQIYGTLNPPATVTSGNFVTLAQSDFVAQPAAHSLASTAYAYVSASCAAGATCGVHVAFHGCEQSASVVGDAFYRHAGLNEWADTNRLIVLYPQAVASMSAPTNPYGCWDFWGYDSPQFATKSGPQLAMVRAMIDWLATAGLD